MRNLFAIVLSAVLISACGESDAVKDTIKRVLRDPDSVRFKRVLVSGDGKIACAVWNAKNGFGGYGDIEISELRKVDGAWKISDKKISVDLCEEDFYKIRDDLRKLQLKILASDKAPENLKNIIKKSMNLEYENPTSMRESLEIAKKYVELL
jgi:hypothetical protein